MSEHNLTKQQEAAAQLIADGELDKTDIAKTLGVSRQTLYHWLEKEYFRARVDTLRQEFESFGRELISSKFTWAVSGYIDLISSTRNDRVKAEGYRYIIDRKLGKPTNKVDLGMKEQREEVDADVLEAEFEQIAERIEYEEE